MTPSSKEFVTPLTLSTVSKNEVFSEFTTEKNSNPTWNNHVELAEWADIFIIAPATSNTISSMSSARCDNLLLACYLSSTCPVFVAPAMDLEMYKNTLNQKERQSAPAHTMLGASWADLGASWAVLGVSWAVLRGGSLFVS